jgi:hypothetical protein
LVDVDVEADVDVDVEPVPRDSVVGRNTMSRSTSVSNP